MLRKKYQQSFLTKTIVGHFETKTDIKSKTLLLNYEENCIEYEKMFDKKFDFEKLLYLYKYDYVVFLSERFFGFFKKKVIELFFKI